MTIYVVITEEYYGGDTLVKAFYSKANAEHYSNTLDIESYIKEAKVSKDTSIIYVAVTEQWFGGEELKIFSNRISAEKHNSNLVKSFGIQPTDDNEDIQGYNIAPDTLVITCDVE